jgi:hypothetical protein
MTEIQTVSYGSAVARVAGSRKARRILRGFRVQEQRQRTGEYDAATELISNHLDRHGPAAEWTHEQWVELGRAFGARSLRWPWSAVAADIVMFEWEHMGARSSLPTLGSLKRAGLRPRDACWKTEATS